MERTTDDADEEALPKASDDEGDPPPKRHKLVEGCRELDRHRAWLERGRSDAKKGTVAKWRPQKLHRVGTKRLLQQEDNQIRCSTQWDGYSSFVYQPDKEVWADKNLMNWPHITMPRDMGSLNVCGMHALLYHWKLNAAPIWDFGHGAHKDLDVALKAVGKWIFWLMRCLDLNLLHGPDDDDWWWTRVQDFMREWDKKHTETNDAIFQYCAPRMHEQLQSVGIVFEDSSDAGLRRFCTDRQNFKKKGYRCNMNRFCVSFRESKLASPYLGYWRVGENFIGLGIRHVDWGEVY